MFVASGIISSSWRGEGDGLITGVTKTDILHFGQGMRFLKQGVKMKMNMYND